MAYISKYTVPVSGTATTYDFKDASLREDISDLQAFIGYDDDRIIGLQADFVNNTYTRLSAARGKSAGSDFNVFNMYGGRRLCNLADDGTVNAWYGDNNYIEDGSNGQVMVYQPKFYYKVVPIELEPIGNNMGYHIRKANYYISDYMIDGFKVHPAFLDANGNELDGIYLSSYEGSIYDVSESKYLVYDDNDFVDGTYTSNVYPMDTTEDKFSSVAGVKPADGNTNRLTRSNVEVLCKNRGNGWHSINAQVISMEQLLMIIELGGFNFQVLLGDGVVSYSSSNGNESSQTGATSSLGNSSGAASVTIHYSSYGVRTEETISKKSSIRYRGVENFYGNMSTYVDGINVWGNGNMRGGMAYICYDYNYSDNKINDNYVPTGFLIANGEPNNFISAFGYSDSCDWTFIPSEISGNSVKPIGDYCYSKQRLNAYKIVSVGGYWGSGDYGGGFLWVSGNDAIGHFYGDGGRIVYIPTASGGE